MKRLIDERIILGAAILGLAGISPIIFPAAQAGLAKMSVLGSLVLLPSLFLLAAVVFVAAVRGHAALLHRVLTGAAAGIVATVGLEVVRIASFQLGGMPGDLPRLMGVLLTDRFMYGPSTGSDVLGWTYHFWNGGVFGITFALLLGRRPLVWYLGYGTVIGLGFLASPAVSSLGIGAFGLGMPSMPITVIAAHAVYGWVLGVLHRRLSRRRWAAEPPMPREQGPRQRQPEHGLTIHEPDPEGNQCA